MLEYEDYKTSMGKLLQCLTTLTVEKVWVVCCSVLWGFVWGFLCLGFFFFFVGGCCCCCCCGCFSPSVSVGFSVRAHCLFPIHWIPL